MLAVESKNYFKGREEDIGGPDETRGLYFVHPWVL